MKLRCTLFVIILLMVFNITNADCPSADVSGDCKVSLDDFTIMASQWLSGYTPADLAALSSQWLMDNSAFEATWNTNLGTGTTVTLPLKGEVDITVDWGDGTIQTFTTDGPFIHDYGIDGIYTVSVTGHAMQFYNSVGGRFGLSDSEAGKLISVDSWGHLGLTSLAFRGSRYLVSVPETSKGIESVTNMDSMFYQARSFDCDISEWDTSHVTSMSGMFTGAVSFNCDISGWDVSNVTSMSGMFAEASSFNGDLNSWDTSNVVYMKFMFNCASSFNGEIGNWDTSRVVDMSSMFAGAISFNGDISGWDTSNVYNMQQMFEWASSFNGEIGNWDTSNVQLMNYMFEEATSFNGDISGWDTSSVTNMEWMFYNASSFNQDLSNWCVEYYPWEPYNFDTGAINWMLPRPEWGTCP